MTFTRSLLAVTAMMLSLALTGCGGQARIQEGAAAAAAHTATTMDGETVTLPSEGKTTVVTFFVAGCASCIEGLYDVVDAKKQNPDAAFVLVDIDPNANPDTVRGFLGWIGAGDLPVVLDKEAELSTAYEVASRGTVIVLDPAGATVFKEIDPAARDILDAIEKTGLFVEAAPHPGSEEPVHNALQPVLDFPRGRNNRIIGGTSGQHPQVVPAVVSHVRTHEQQQSTGGTRHPRQHPPHPPHQAVASQGDRDRDNTHNQTHPHAVAEEQNHAPHIEPLRNEDATMSKNGAMAQLNDATAYAMPKTTMDSNDRLTLGPPGLGTIAGSSRPSNSHTPAAANTTPITIVSHGR